MELNIVHVVTDLTKINFGIWNAAVFGSSYLKEQHRIKSVLVVCQEEKPASPALDLPVVFVGSRPSAHQVIDALRKWEFQVSTTVVVTHGCWKQPTRVGYELKRRGFKWLYVPHGMLEPWSLSNHWFKKKIYFHLVEKRLLNKSDAVRAVSPAEQKNLELFLKREVFTVENGVPMPPMPVKEMESIRFLFMARLHYKKGIVPLVKTWSKSMRGSGAKLLIAGPDEGEHDKIKPFLNENIEYLGAVYGEDKITLLQKCHYYLLPSYSEGFPTSVVEAMSYGLIPLISKGCNFPQVFEEKLGYCIEPEEKDIEQRLLSLKDLPFDAGLSQRNHDYTGRYYSEEAIGEKLVRLYSGLFQS